MLAMNSPWLCWLSELEQRNALEVILILSISQAELGDKPIFHFSFFKEQRRHKYACGYLIPISKARRFVKIAGL